MKTVQWLRSDQLRDQIDFYIAEWKISPQAVKMLKMTDSLEKRMKEARELQKKIKSFQGLDNQTKVDLTKRLDHLRGVS